ncbi:MAG: Nif11-like leader peptide family RiPP precursor [Deferribacterales bacterium]
MSIENVKAFFSRLETDEDFRSELVQHKSLEKENPDSVFKAAGDVGYPFTKEEFELAKNEINNIELTDDQLQKVAGGIPLISGKCSPIGINS